MTELEEQLKQDAIAFINRIDNDKFEPLVNAATRYVMLAIKTHQSYALLKYDKQEKLFCKLSYDYWHEGLKDVELREIPLDISFDLSKNYPHSENISDLLNK